MPSYRTPDVYTEEIPTLPPSVAEVSTAVPAFIGHTHKAEKEGTDVSGAAVRISTFLEYKEIFGGPDNTTFNVVVDGNQNIKSVEATTSKNTLYYQLDFFFKNGGGACYIVSVGKHTDALSKDGFNTGLDIVSKEDEPTLLMIGEATGLAKVDYYEICTSALSQCATLKDRFCIFDVLDDDEGGADFRKNIGMNNLKYGAAYTPYLQTTLNYIFDESAVSVEGLSMSAGLIFDTAANGIRISYSGASSDGPKVKILKGDDADDISFTVQDNTLTISNTGDGKLPNDFSGAWATHTSKGSFNVQVNGEGTDAVSSGSTSWTTLTEAGSPTLETLKSTRTALYSKIKTELTKQRITLPPSSGIAGVYSTTDRERGVWKAPANVSLNAVIAPTEKITSADQERLNVDENAGKSINAIRSFFGKGTLVWGARTLAGNDNEWRYVPVRRLFNMIEESTKKASYFAVFEPNDATTWLKVKAMIDSYLYGLWTQGALAGATAEQAYVVNVGLGKTMTQQDVLEGRMIVEIGVAAVRPAEFIILRFSHKLQES